MQIKEERDKISSARLQMSSSVSIVTGQPWHWGNVRDRLPDWKGLVLAAAILKMALCLKYPELWAIVSEMSSAACSINTEVVTDFENENVSLELKYYHLCCQRALDLKLVLRSL